MAAGEIDLSKLTPEQIAQLQNQNCIFCHIISGRVDSRKVYEDDESLAILDINPANAGHVLLMPKEHYSIMQQLPEHLAGKLYTVAKHISQASLRVLKEGGSTILTANGAIAGQRAPHFMIHIIPRVEGDGLELRVPEYRMDTKALSDVSKKLSVLPEYIGGKTKVIMGSPVPSAPKKLAEEEKPGKGKPGKRTKKAGKEKPDLDRLAKMLLEKNG